MSIEKPNLHPRNLHRSRYDFPDLVRHCPELKPFVFVNPYGDESIDFANPNAVKRLNQALLSRFYNIEHWDIPANYLCPPIPGRSDYIHYAADLLAEINQQIIPKGDQVRVLDIGVGANCIYPILGHQLYGWEFVGADIDAQALACASQIAGSNSAIQPYLSFRNQQQSKRIFKGIVQPSEFFDLTICNPPFHSSAEEARLGSQRKARNLGKLKGNAPKLNFGGQKAELWCEGGEVRFIQNMITESQAIGHQCCWFTTLVAKSEHLPVLITMLKNTGAKTIKTIEMAQGQKQSRLIAWSFLSVPLQLEWAQKRWSVF